MSRKSILILYGSETGTAQDVAESLRREAQMRHASAKVFEMDDYDFDKLPKEDVVLFVVSTTGQGEMPPNMRRLWKLFLRKSLGPLFLKKIHTSVLALGDSSYQKYNFAGKKLYRRLQQLGANIITPIALADDRHEIGIDGALIPWKTDVFQKIKELEYYRNMTNDIDPKRKITTKYRFLGFEDDFESSDAEMSSEEEELDDDEMPIVDKAEEQEYRALKVISNQRVTTEDNFQDTRLVNFEIPSDISMTYNPGDVLMVRPYNLEKSVQIAIEALGFSPEILDKPVKVVKNDKYCKLPPYYLIGETTTLRTLFIRYFDLQQIPKRSFFEMLAHYSNDETEKEKLKEYASPEGLDDLLDYANRRRRTTAEALRDFPATSKHLKPHHLFEILTTIRPRAFSIASAPSTTSVELLVAKVEYKTVMADKRRGLCSTFISRLKEGDEVFCRVRPGTFKFPGPETPIICVGPGTGVAPFRSVFGHRSRNPESRGILFFGCRKEHSDFYFRDEWPNMSGVKVVTAFSQDQEAKIYVQHKMIAYRDQLQKMLWNKNPIFIAGSSGDMPKAVTSVLEMICGEEWVREAEKSGQIQFETWS
ncbi:unnamed protein product [Caenorhabditis brenneri]